MGRKYIARLDRKTIVELHCGICEAERSLHRVLDPSAAWLDFQQYFSAKKTESLRQLTSRLSPHVPIVQSEMPALRDELLVTLPPGGLLRVLCARLSAVWKSSWTFAPRELRFMAIAWQSFFCCLALREKPGADRLISLRKDFRLAGFILETRCLGVREINHGGSVAHFRQSEGLKTVSLDDLLNDAA
jgi:hypothetical protein